MVVRKGKLSKNERRVMELARQHWSAPDIAKHLRIAPSTIRDILARLEHRGLIIHICGSSPKLYGDPTEQSSTVEAYKPKDPKSVENITDVQTEHTTTLTVEGICIGPKAPSNFVRWHVTNGIDYNLRLTGTFDDPIGADGTHTGYWKKPKTANNTEFHTVVIRVFGQDIEALYRHGHKTGKESFTLYPGSIFADPRSFTDPQDILPHFIKRAEYIAQILSRTGWQLTDPQIRGKIHWATRDAELLQHFRKDTNIQDAELTTDTSHSEDEVEMENLSDEPNDLARKKAEYMAFLPSRGLAAEAKIEEQGRMIAEQTSDLEEMKSKMDGIIALLGKQNHAILLLTDNEGKIISSLTAIEENNLRIEEILATQERLSTSQLRINTNLIKNISDGTQHTLDTFRQPEHPGPAHRVLGTDEGYQ